MGLLKSVDNVPGIDYYDYRDNQYYNKYEYRLRTKISGIRYTWYCQKPEDLDKKIAGKSKDYGNVRNEDKQQVIDNLSALKTIIKLQKSKKQSQIGIRIEGNTVAIFSNNLSVLKDLETEIGQSYEYDYTQVQATQYVGVKQFVHEPKHKYRVYLKTKRIDENIHKEIRDNITRTKFIFPSAALKKWMYKEGRHSSWNFRWTSAGHFIDYDDESTLSYLALMHGEILGKKYKLEKRPDNI